MFSGLMPHRNGMIGLAHRGFKLKKDIPYLPGILRDNGYKTFLFGVQHEIQSGKQEELGYQNFLTAETKFCNDICGVFCKFLEECPPEPFFASVGVVETHQRYPIVENPPGNLKIPGFLPDCIEVKKDIAGLNIFVQRVDETIGRIISTLEKTGKIDNTLIIFTTDHGIAMPGAKATLFDPGIEIFLIMKGPGIPERKKLECLSSNVDLVPTILDYLGIKIPDNIDGVSLMPVVKDGKKQIRECIYTELTYHAGYDPMRSIRTNKYKYIRSFEVRPFYFPVNVDASFSKGLFKQMGYFDRLRPFEFFFDLEKDPLERKNLINDPEYRVIIDGFRKQLISNMKKTKDPLVLGPVPLPKNCTLSVPWGYDPEQIWTES